MPRVVIVWATVLLVALVGATAAAGLFAERIYAQETVSWAAQGAGQDAVNLTVALPCLILSAVLARRGSLRALLVWLGIVLYFIYSYVIYAFFIHFGPPFLAYVATLGVSFYALVFGLHETDVGGLAASFGPRTPNRLVSVVLLVLTIVFAALWLSEIVPSLAHGTAPKSLAEVGLIVNPVHILDLALVLPGMAIAAILLWRKHPIGYVSAAVLLAFSVVMGAAIVGMDISMLRKGLLHSLAAALPIGIVSAVSLAALWLLLAGMEFGSAELTRSRV
jgi:hypothetical protein